MDDDEVVEEALVALRFLGLSEDTVACLLTMSIQYLDFRGIS